MLRGTAAVLALCVLGVLTAGAADAARPPGGGAGPGWPVLEGLIVGAEKTMMADPRGALQKAREAETVAEGLAASPRQKEAVATVLWLEAEALTRVNRSGEARQVLSRALAAAGRGKVRKLDGDLALANARIASSEGNVGLALKSYQRAHDIFAKLGEARGESIALQGLGAIYDEAHDFNREISYYHQAEQVYSAEPAIELSIANNIGYAYQQLGRYDDATAKFQQALKIAKTMRSPFLQAYILTSLAYVYAKDDKLTDATKAADQALALLGPNDQTGQTPFAWGVKAQIEYERGNLKVAAHDLDKAFHGIDLKTTIAPFRDMHKIAYEIYKAVGNYPLALQHLEAFMRLDDEGRSLTASANLALMGAQFDFATQRLEIEHLRSEQLKRDISLKESRAATQRVIFAALLFAALLLLIWIGWRHLLMRRHRNAIALKNVALTHTLGERDVEIARRTEVEAHLRVAMAAAEQANLSKSHFLANMSHELRTPLNAIIGFSEMIGCGGIAGAKLKEYADDIHASGQNLLVILNDILDMARIDAGTVSLAETEVTLGEVIGSAISEIECAMTARSKTILFDSSGQSVAVRGDEKRLRQILVNLLSNAVKFTGDQGRIAVRIELTADGVDIVVSDNGIGIPEDKLDTIMEPFGQAEGAYARLHGGVGLGLPIVKSLVQLHGGAFKMTSTVDVGTDARVHLPMGRVLRAPRAALAAIAS